MVTIGTKVLNLFIAGFWLWLFQKLEWITFDPKLGLIQAIFLTALLAWAAQTVFAHLVVIVGYLTCGLGCIAAIILAPLWSWIILSVLSNLTGLFVINIPILWQGVIMSVLFGFFRLPDVTASIKSSSSSRRSSDF